MSTLTKILIVVMVVLSIPFSVLLIQQVNTVANYRQAFLSEQSQRAATEAVARMERNLANEAQAKARQLQSKLDKQAEDFAAQAARDEVSLDRLTAENARLKNTLEAMSTKLAGLEGSVEEQVTMNRMLSNQLEQRAGTIAELNDQLRKTTLQAQELSRNLETARQNVTVKQSLLTSAEEKIRDLQEKLRRGGAAVAAGGEPAPMPAARIEGRVEAVSLEDNVAQLNVGSASGVEMGMKFILYRGSTYVGELTIAQVQASNSAGVLSANLQAAPQRGDKAVTDLAVE